MKFNKGILRLYGVTDRQKLLKKPLLDVLETLLRGGITCVQLREKEMDKQEFLEEAKLACALCHRYNVPFIVNDSVEIALLSGADGVHLGQGDMRPDLARKQLGPDKIIGATARTVEQAIEAQRLGADYIGSGAVFGTETKSDAKYLPIEAFREITKSVSVPVVAIGGICEENILKLYQSGAAGVAVASALFNDDITEEKCRGFLNLAMQL